MAESESEMAAPKKTPAKHAPAKPAPAAEEPKLSRHEKFVKLANRRVRKVLHGLEQIGNLSSSNYEYSEAEVDKLTEVLSNALQSCVDRFQPREKRAKKEATDIFAA